jgi:hypothetical protein
MGPATECSIVIPVFNEARNLDDDWDFGIKLRASGEELVFAPRSRVRINPRRIQEGLDDMLEGVAYGRNGIITMNDYRPLRPAVRADLSAAQAGRLFANAIKDFTPKNLILPLLLTPELLERQPVLAFLTPSLCARLAARIEAIKAQMQIKNFLPNFVHYYAEDRESGEAHNYFCNGGVF